MTEDNKRQLEWGLKDQLKFLEGKDKESITELKKEIGLITDELDNLLIKKIELQAKKQLLEKSCEAFTRKRDTKHLERYYKKLVRE